MSAVPLRHLRPAAPHLTATTRPKQSFADFIASYRERMAHIFDERADANDINEGRGLPPHVLGRMREVDPLSVYIPESFGGRGGHIWEGQAVLEETGYQSLALCLMVGINGGLFLQPVSKYGVESAKERVFKGFLQNKHLGGLMITEPDYGSDALHMQTSWSQSDRGTYRVKGTKHWAGLTGWADYWLLTARAEAPNGNLQRDVDFFIADQTQAAEVVRVEKLYPNLGLRMLPYGLNQIDVELPGSARLQPETTGVKLMLDVLHRSRLQFPGMGMGFLRRLMDDAVAHCKQRFVGGDSLVTYDQVRARLSRIQAFVTSCAAMCLDTSENAGIDRDLSSEGIKANAFKTSVTDWMQDASQSFLQLMGAEGYRADHLAGRATVDSRPFQIFEGSNDILYQQITESFVKGMRKVKETNLGRYLRDEPLTARAAELFGESLHFDVDWKMPQRKLVELGRALSRIVSMEMTIELGERGYASDLIHNALDHMRADVQSIVESYRVMSSAALVEDASAPDWLARVRTA